MKSERILVLGACGQIGVELTLTLRELYGSTNVIASDVRQEHEHLTGNGPFIPIDVLDKSQLHVQIVKQQITQIYLLAATLSATAEKKPITSWNLNIQALLNVLEIAREEKLDKVFWPSSIAVFGPDAPKWNCPQEPHILPTTVYGISKHAGEHWCQYYFTKYGVDVRSLRYPGLISYKSEPGGGTTDYANEIYFSALSENRYTCYLKADTFLPMMYMKDALRATIELMEAPAGNVKIRTSYNVAAISFSPANVEKEIKEHLPRFRAAYRPDYRQDIADSWPASIDDSVARADWNWKHEFELKKITSDMLQHIGKKKCVINH